MPIFHHPFMQISTWALECLKRLSEVFRFKSVFWEKIAPLKRKMLTFIWCLLLTVIFGFIFLGTETDFFLSIGFLHSCLHFIAFINFDNIYFSCFPIRFVILRQFDSTVMVVMSTRSLFIYLYNVLISYTCFNHKRTPQIILMFWLIYLFFCKCSLNYGKIKLI